MRVCPPCIYPTKKATTPLKLSSSAIFYTFVGWICQPESSKHEISIPCGSQQRAFTSWQSTQSLQIFKSGFGKDDLINLPQTSYLSTLSWDLFLTIQAGRESEIWRQSQVRRSLYRISIVFLFLRRNWS